MCTVQLPCSTAVAYLLAGNWVLVSDEVVVGWRRSITNDHRSHDPFSTILNLVIRNPQFIMTTLLCHPAFFLISLLILCVVYDSVGVTVQMTEQGCQFSFFYLLDLTYFYNILLGKYAISR